MFAIGVTVEEAYKKKRETEMGLDYTSCNTWKLQFRHQDNQTVEDELFNS